MTLEDDAVVVNFQAVQPDGCISLELNETLRDLRAKGWKLSEGQRLAVWERWGDSIHHAEGIVRLDPEWGWGVRIAAENRPSWLPSPGGGRS